MDHWEWNKRIEILGICIESVPKTYGGVVNGTLLVTYSFYGFTKINNQTNVTLPFDISQCVHNVPSNGSSSGPSSTTGRSSGSATTGRVTSVTTGVSQTSTVTTAISQTSSVTTGVVGTQNASGNGGTTSELPAESFSAKFAPIPILSLLIYLLI